MKRCAGGPGLIFLSVWRLVPGGRNSIAGRVCGSKCRGVRRQWSHLSLPHHLQHFRQRTLERVAERAGLCCTGIATESLVWSVEAELCRWFRRNLLLPYRLSQWLHLFQPAARYRARRGERADRGDAIVAHFRL